MREIWRDTAIATVGLVAAIDYVIALRPWYRSWGATPAESGRGLSGDGLIAEPKAVMTRAITIHAPPDDVWPEVVELAAAIGGGLARFNPPHALVLYHERATGPGCVTRTSRAFVLEEDALGATRLIVRTRVAFAGGARQAIARHAREPFEFLAERRRLLELRRRGAQRLLHLPV
ncbi:MAG TPA: hypothetical protein VFF06_11060 [Polyangia bacterium]|nr:hypothetical protein [Polyangia bacterium]